MAPSKANGAIAPRARFLPLGPALAAALAVAGACVLAGPGPSPAPDASQASPSASAQDPGGAAATAAPSASAPSSPPVASQASSASSAGAGAEGSVRVEPQRARIGDPIRVTVSYAAPGVWKAAPGDELKPGEKLGSFHILATDAGAPGVFQVTLGADETGALATPAFQVVFKDAGGASVTVAAPSAKITIASVLADGDSTALADLKAPAELPVPWPWAALALLGVGLAAAAAATWWIARWLRRERAPRMVPEIALPPGMTPEQWAREELARLVASGLLAEGRHRECHIAMADLVRRYVELRFHIPAMERTTEEIADEMPRALVDEALVRLTVGVLGRCDRVKFAKHVPSADEVQDTLARIRETLDRGVPAAAPLAPPPSKDPAPSLPASSASGTAGSR